MNDRDYQEEFRRLLLEPLNQVAALKLKENGLASHPGVLPLFRLMEWGLAIGIPPTHPKTARKLLQLRHMRDQRRAVEYLLEVVPEGGAALGQRLLHLDPGDAAEELIELLDCRLMAEPGSLFDDDSGLS